MKIAVKQGATVRLTDADLPAPDPDEIRIKVNACGICGTDLHVNLDETKESSFGHEIAGTILETGSEVHHLAVGQNIVLESASACGRCTNCRNARQDLCTDIRSFFELPIRGFSEQMNAPAISAIPYDGLSPEEATLSEPLGVAIDLVRIADITFDSNVLVMGPGPIGLMAIALAKKKGARRVFCSAFERETIRAETALALGADAVMDPSKVDLKEVDFGCEIDRVLVTAPPPVLPDAVAVAANGGIISFIGIGQGENAFCRFNANDFHFKKLQLRASFASPALMTPLALTYLKEGVIDGQALISHRFVLSDIEKAIQVARDGSKALKVIIKESLS